MKGENFNIYLDDVYIRDQTCLPPGDCDFENGLCKSKIRLNRIIYKTNMIC